MSRHSFLYYIALLLTSGVSLASAQYREWPWTVPSVGQILPRPDPQSGRRQVWCFIGCGPGTVWGWHLAKDCQCDDPLAGFDYSQDWRGFCGKCRCLPGSYPTGNTEGGGTRCAPCPWRSRKLKTDQPGLTCSCVFEAETGYRQMVWDNNAKRCVCDPKNPTIMPDGKGGCACRDPTKRWDISELECR